MTQQQLAGPLRPKPLARPEALPPAAASVAAAGGTAPAPSTYPKFSPSPPGPAAPSPPTNTYTPSALKGIAASALQQPESPVSQDITPPPPPPLTTTSPSTRTAVPPPPPPPPKTANPSPPPLKLTTNIPMATSGFSGTPASRPSAESASSGVAAQRQPRSATGGKRPSMRQLAADRPTMNEGQRDQQMRDIIHEQFGLEILIKHKELQDIEAELMKAEACLEQIRKCSVDEAMEKDGLLDDPNNVAFMYKPSEASMNGPYGNWLAEERVSNRVPYHDVLAQDQSRNFVLGRRGMAAQEVTTPASAASKRPQREAAAAAALSQKRPSICLHRQHDGSLVKLTCIDCKRSQFGSMQGFINHCRLAHQRDFQTHDHAAAACGTPFDPTGYDGQLPPPRSSRAASKYANTPTAPKNGGRNTSNQKVTPKPNVKKSSTGVAEGGNNNNSNLQTGPPTPPFNPEELSIPKTIQTSHLKEYLSKKQVAVENLDSMVEEAVNRVGMVDESDGDEDEAEEEIAKDAGFTENPVDKSPAPAPAAAPQQDKSPETTDVEMMDTPPVERTIEVKGDRIISVTPRSLTVDTAAVDSIHEGNEDMAEVSESSNSRMTTSQNNQEADREPSSRPSSRRSNTAARQSPRTPVAPTPARMGTRAHPSPDAETPSTRHSARLADSGKRA
ncbi:hypothetical protein TWF696_009834 [Orbilia brochopaga]|uniref:AHC1-like C2H2 zinc-finger domain-containing protein n=1 Tax=Orbilia brochopaga TaxID=3140254 RepID=A0AAV9UC50_9PEZI